MAKQTLIEAMRRLRLVAPGLRQDSVRSLEKALVRYIDSAGADTEMRLRVSGDERWAPLPVIDEAFLIIREAIRNALAHSSPRLVLIGVALAPHELLAWVEDDGTGFVVSQARGPETAGTGLASMRERAAMLGGRLRIASAPDRFLQEPGKHCGLNVCSKAAPVRQSSARAGRPCILIRQPPHL